MKLIENRAYRSWVAMRGRILRPQKKDIVSYRGLTITPKWDIFAGFLEDMGERPEGTSLDRRDNKKGYFKENCKWSTPTEQTRNRRVTRLIMFNGVEKTLAEHCKDRGLRYGLVWRRIFLEGWKIEYALTTPSLPRGALRRKVDKKYFM